MVSRPDIWAMVFSISLIFWPLEGCVPMAQGPGLMVTVASTTTSPSSTTTTTSPSSTTTTTPPSMCTLADVPNLQNPPGMLTPTTAMLGQMVSFNCVVGAGNNFLELDDASDNNYLDGNDAPPGGISGPLAGVCDPATGKFFFTPNTGPLAGTSLPLAFYFC